MAGVILTPTRKLKTGTLLDKSQTSSLITHIEETVTENIIGDIDDTPVDGAITSAISSNWAYDHVAASDPHTGYILKSLFDADTFLYASTDNVPVATSPANVLAALSGHAAATFDFNNQALSNVNGIALKNATVISATTQTSYIELYGGTIPTNGASITLAGADYSSGNGKIWVRTPDFTGSNYVDRLTITGLVTTSVATWAAITHTGFDITSGQVLKVGGVQVVAARIVNAGIDDAIEAAFTTLYPNASAVLAALQAGIQTHGLITPT